MAVIDYFTDRLDAESARKSDREIAGRDAYNEALTRTFFLTRTREID